MRKILVSLCTILTLSAVTVPTIVSAEQSKVQIQKQTDDSIKFKNSKKREAAILSFTAMQDRITQSMTIKNGRYVYNEETIKKIIASYDFAKLKEDTAIAYDASTFFKVAMENIKRTEFKTKVVRGGNTYNENKFEEGWNYGRFWWDEGNTTKKIAELREAASQIDITGVVGDGVLGVVTSIVGTVFSGILAAAISMGVGIESWLLNNIADNLEKVQDGTGTVLEINKFTAVYDCWAQDKYPG